MQVEKIEDLELKPSTFVKFTELGNITEVQYNTHKNHKCNIVRLDKDHLMVVGTAEVKEVVHYESREDDKKSVARSLKKLRDLINCNVTNVDNVIWFTLTYKENMQDPEKLYIDFKNFNKRFKYYEEQKGIDSHEYIICAEPQGRGAWHIHGLFIWQCKAPYIPHDDFWRLWSKKGYEYRNVDGIGYDFVNIKSLKDCDNVGAYLTAYLGDMSLEEYQLANPFSRWQGDVKTCNVRTKSGKVEKKILKGARLKYYPAGFRMFRCSRGVKRPQSETITFENAQKKVRTALLTFKKSVKITDTNGYNTRITTYYYNKALFIKKRKRTISIILFSLLLSREFKEKGDLHNE